MKITLKYSEPLIWRRVVVRSDMRLYRLHGVIQRVMGWTDSHLHQFIVGEIYYGTPDPQMMDFVEQRNEKRYTISDVAPSVKSRFVMSTTSAIAGNTRSLSRKFNLPIPNSCGLFVLREQTPVHRMTVGVFLVITICSRSSPIRRVRSTSQSRSG
ncbi:MAG TPA: plasmid pRiA4b ORF-3 family protein [Pyrinomonadaceae bacterium]|nr:plasmid pRiA4b ORF-3 family protein [Pyrinomonadaceae bacterium]